MMRHGRKGCDDPSVEEIMEAVPGLSKQGAYYRLWQMRRGELEKKELFLPHRAKTGIGNAGLPTRNEIMAAVPGLSRSGAESRLRKYRTGSISIMELFGPLRTWQSQRNTSNHGTPEWQALGVRERRENIPGIKLGTREVEELRLQE